MKAEQEPCPHSDERSFWQAEIRRRMNNLLDLNEGWDGYDAPGIPSQTAMFSVQILEQLWRPGLSLPDISPMSDGSIMLEWFKDDAVLTIEIENS